MNRVADMAAFCKFGMPHVRGDEPDTDELFEDMMTVCPTCVGMNRDRIASAKRYASMPHVRGDEP